MKAWSTKANVGALMLANALNMLLPLVVMPLVVTRVGIVAYGQVALMQSYWLMAGRVVSWGFDWTAGRELATVRDGQRAAVVGEVFWARLLLLALVLGLSGCVFAVVPKLRSLIFVGVACSGVAVSGWLSGTWALSAMERGILVMWSTAWSRGLAALAIVLFVWGGHATYIYAGIVSGQWLVMSALTCVALMRQIRVRLSAVPLHRVLQRVRCGATVAFAGLLHGGYTSANGLLLGLLSQPDQVGIYAVSEKIVLNVAALVDPAVRGTYAAVSRMAVKDDREDEAARVGKLYGWYAIVFGVVATGAVMLGAEPLAHVFAKAGAYQIVTTLRIMALVILPSIAGYVVSSQKLLAGARDLAYLVVVGTGALLNVSMASWLARRFGAAGMAGCYCVSEGLVFAGFLLASRLPGSWRRLRARWLGDSVRVPGHG